MKQKKNEFCSSKIFQESSERAQPNWKTKLISCHTPVVESTRYADLAFRIAENFLRLKIRLSRELDEWFRFREYSSGFQIRSAASRTHSMTTLADDRESAATILSFPENILRTVFSITLRSFFEYFLTIFQIKTERQISLRIRSL